jgi:hypothetical protein
MTELKINWTKVGDRIPSNEGQDYEGSPSTPFVPCLVWACNPEYIHGGVCERVRWDSKNNEWDKNEIALNWALQPPYVITHFCDDKIIHP